MGQHQAPIVALLEAARVRLQQAKVVADVEAMKDSAQVCPEVCQAMQEAHRSSLPFLPGARPGPTTMKRRSSGSRLQLPVLPAKPPFRAKKVLQKSDMRLSLGRKRINR